MYSISKTTLLGLTKTVAEELAGDGIRVNCIAPGVIKTKFAEPVCAFSCIVNFLSSSFMIHQLTLSIF